MTILYAQPYDLAATGLYFESGDDYASKVSLIRNDCGHPVEEFEIQFIDGETIAAKLFEALSINQCIIDPFFDSVTDRGDHQKIKAILYRGHTDIQFVLKPSLFREQSERSIVRLMLKCLWR